MSLCLVLLLCNRETKLMPPPPGDYLGDVDEFIGTIDNDDERVVEDDASFQDELPHLIHDIWTYNPQNFLVPAQTTIERAVCSSYPNMVRSRNYTNLGGPKLIGEMSADRVGYKNSYYDFPITINVLSLAQLNLSLVSSSNNIVFQVLAGVISIESVYISSSWAGMDVNVDALNLSNEQVLCEIRQGQMIEVSANHVQNVVVSSGTSIQIPPHQRRNFFLPVLCAAKQRSSPVGSRAKITPYVLGAPSAAYIEQERIWEYISRENYSENVNKYVTFYVWGKGTVTRSGRPSPTGHAFVRVPNIGVIGFGTRNNMILDDEGVITDHTQSVRYATDSCRIIVSDASLLKISKKIRELKRDVPRYKIGRYDCTSFVMDIADAGDIRYGRRITIQTPVGFMQGLKKHNRLY